MTASWEPPGHRLPLRDEPGDDIRDLLRRQWRHSAAQPPVRHSEIRASRDDRRSEMLIAHEREIRRIGDAAAFPTATPVLFVTPDAGRDEDGVTTVDVAGVAARRGTVVVGRNAVVRDHTRQLPTIPDSLRQDVDLPIGERTTGAQRERRLCRPRDPGGDHLAYAF